MKSHFDLSTLDWTLTGWTPYLWQFQPILESSQSPDAIVSVPARVPGSVQAALRDAGVLPDWNQGIRARECEWVENRHWLFETPLPDEWFKAGKIYRLACQGLDYSGWVYLNGKEIGRFCGTHLTHSFDLTPYLLEKHNYLRIAFDVPPRWLGQFGFSSQMQAWKTRFNYTWDWQPRLVQIGIWDRIEITASDGYEISTLQCTTDADWQHQKGILNATGHLSAPIDARLLAQLKKGDSILYQEEVYASQFSHPGFHWQELPIELWWPNLAGDQPLYYFELTLKDAQGRVLDQAQRRVGFRNIVWQACEGAPQKADPWICVVNGRPIFLQGVNFPPIRPNYADISEADYRQRLDLYRELGVNTFRINACGYLEKECFYDLCDELGFLVWQEFPLTSSGVDNIPPSDEASMQVLEEIAASFITRRQHHPSLLLWCGGNELTDLNQHPLDDGHPMLRRLKAVCQRLDPLRRYLATSPSGPRFSANTAEYGQGIDWDIHGEWKPTGSLQDWEAYWNADDALFRSEVGAPGCASLEMIRKYKGECQELPIHNRNPLWCNPIAWWLQDEQFAIEKGYAPASLEEYVAWSQDRQARALVIAVNACKQRFPRCGGVLLWMGHDSFPCPANTAIIDFEGQPKPAALVLKALWHEPPAA